MPPPLLPSSFPPFSGCPQIVWRHKNIFAYLHPKIHSKMSFPPVLPLLAILASISAFSFVRAQADPRLEDDLFLRNLLLRQYLASQPVNSIAFVDRIVPAESSQEAASAEEQVPAVAIWRQRRTPAERAKLFRLSDQYTPTPCRWKLCASIFKGGFQR